MLNKIILGWNDREMAGFNALILVVSLPVALMVLICNYFVDRPVSMFVKKQLYGNIVWSELTSQLPDALLLAVVLISGVSYLLYWSKKNKRPYDANMLLFKSVALSLPVAYVVKSILKNIFGRIETRVWLRDSQQYGFHWFDGGPGFSGFPSGHVAVFTTLAAAIWRTYPHQKPLLCLSLLILGILLVTTNYHFVSDVICGAYLGVLIESSMFVITKHKEHVIDSN